MLRSGDLRASLAQARDDDLRERDVRDAVLRERRGEVRGRDSPDLGRVRAEEKGVERAAHGLHHPVLGRHERARTDAAADALGGVIGERSRGEDGRHRLRDVERLERVLVVLAAELDAHVLAARREAVGRDLLEHVEHALVARVIRVRAEIESRARFAAQGRGEAAQEVLSFEERDLLAMFSEGEPGGEPADAAAEHDGVAQEGLILGFRWAGRSAEKHDLNLGMPSSGNSEPAIGRDDRDPKRVSQCGIHGVIGGEVRSQGPCPLHEDQGWVTKDRKVDEGI